VQQSVKATKMSLFCSFARWLGNKRVRMCILFIVLKCPVNSPEMLRDLNGINELSEKLAFRD